MSVVPKLAGRSLRARFGRNIFIALTILAGVAFVSGSFVLADSLGKTFDNLIDGLTGEIDLEVRSELTVDELDAVRDPLPASLIDDVADISGVGLVEGTISRNAQLLDPDGKPVRTQGAPTLGVSWAGETALSGVKLKAGRAPLGSDEIAIDKETADRVGYSVGDQITVVVPQGKREFTIVGLVGLGNTDGFVGATTAVWDYGTASEVLDAEGMVDAIDIKVAAGADAASVQQTIAGILPERAEVITGKQLADEIKDQFGEIISFLRIGLLIFAVITAFVAAFVINNVFGITVGQRLRELALLRAVGANARQIRRLVVIEALAVAVVATIIGIFGGLLVARGIIAAFNSQGGGFPSTSMILQPRTAIVASFVGIGITLISVLVPAVRASRIPPVAAMRPELGFTGGVVTRRIFWGAAFTTLGVVLFLLGLFGNVSGGPAFAATLGGGALLTFIGVTGLSTAVARPLSRAIGAPIAKLFGTAGRIARDNAGRSPRRTARTASALMVGVALICAAAVFASSLRDTFVRILDRAIKADYIVWDPESFQLLPPEVAARLEALPELSAVSPFRTIRGDVDEDTISFTAVDPEAFPELVDVEVSAGGFDDLANDGIVLFKDEAIDRRLDVGDEVAVTWQNGVESTLTVSGIFDDNALDAAYLISIATLESVSTQTAADQFVLAKRADGVDAAAATAAVRAALEEFPQANPETAGEFRDRQESQINSILYLITILLLVAIAFSFLGIAITMALSVFERTHEIGLLRAIGMNRRQLRRSIRWEAVIVALFGVVIGIVVGIGFGVALSYAVPNNVIDGITFPIGTLIAVVIVAIVAAVVAALYPAFKASRMNVLEAIATE